MCEELEGSEAKEMSRFFRGYAFVAYRASKDILKHEEASLACGSSLNLYEKTPSLKLEQVPV